MTSSAVIKFIEHGLTRRSPLSPALVKHEEGRAGSVHSRIADAIILTQELHTTLAET